MALGAGREKSGAGGQLGAPAAPPGAVEERPSCRPVGGTFTVKPDWAERNRRDCAGQVPLLTDNSYYLWGVTKCQMLF